MERGSPRFFTCTSFLMLLVLLLLPPACSSRLLWLWSAASDLVALSLGDDTVLSAALSGTFIVSVSTVSDILIAKSYREMLANTENLEETDGVQ